MPFFSTMPTEGRCTTSTFGIGDLHFPVDNRPIFEGQQAHSASNSVDFPCRWRR